MLIGNKLTLGFELRPLSPSWERRYAPEQAAWAAVIIWVGGTNLCRHLLPGSDRVQDALNVPLVPIADWLSRSWSALAFEEQAPELRTGVSAHQALRIWADTRSPVGLSEDAWLDARERWWSRHFLHAGADGAQLPNLAFVRQDDSLVIDWGTARFAGYEPPVLLASPGQHVVPWADAREAFRGLVGAVAEWIREAGLQIQFPWAERPDPLSEREGTPMDRLSFFTGRSRERLLQLAGVETDEALLTWLRLPAGARDPGASPISQALRDLPRRGAPGIADVLLDLGERTSRPAVTPRPGWLEARALAHDATRGASTPEESGQRAAAAVREAWGLNGQPIGDLDALLGDADVEIRDTGVRATQERMVTGARADGSAVALVLATSRTETRWGRRFELARALGHVVLDPMREGAVGAASSPFSQETRRRRSGAFAAELLLPEDALGEVSDGVLDGAAEPEAFEALLARFGVGARTAANQLWNRGWLSSATLRDELVDRYAARSEG